MPNNATVVNLPTDLKNEQALKTTLQRIITELNILLGYTQGINGVDSRFEQIVRRLEAIENRLDSIESENESTTAEIRAIKNQVNSQIN